jgi:hypothetical protein
VWSDLASPSGLIAITAAVYEAGQHEAPHMSKVSVNVCIVPFGCVSQMVKSTHCVDGTESNELN